jgi:hypothetical protein
MVYKPAHEPAAISAAAAKLAHTAIRNESREYRAREHKAAVLYQLVEEADQLSAIQPLERGVPGYLRFAVVDHSGSRVPVNRLGVMRAYPRTLHEQVELAPQLLPGEPPTPGAAFLRKSLFTLPTHSFVTGTDLLALQRWMHQKVAETRNSAPTTGSLEAPEVLSKGWSHW